MKFKAINKDGTAREFTAEEKVPVALQDAVIAYDRFKDKEHVWIRNTVVNTISVLPKGDKFKGLYSNDMYSASGTTRFHRRSLATGDLLSPLFRHYRIKFEDVLDYNGQPDLKITHFEEQVL